MGTQIPLLAGKIQGISSIRSSVARQRGPKRPSTQCLTSQFPTHPNREFFEALQGIKSGDQGNFFPHQGIRSRPLFGICFDDKCDRPDRPRLCREGEEGAARCSKPPKPISSSRPAFVHVNGAPGMSPDLVDANDRRSGPYDGEVGRVARRPGAPSSPQTGTEGSQPLPPLPGTLGFL